MVAFTLAVLLVTVSAYIRLSQGGTGCTPWPGCYSQVGDAQASFPVAALTHRLTASTLGVLILLLNVGAWIRGRQRTLSAMILATTILLAILGLRSGGLLLPAVVLGNFLGGLLLATLLGWLMLVRYRPAEPAPPYLRAIPAAMLLVAAAVIVTGIGSSAFYGNGACKGLFDCGTLQSPTQLAPFMPLSVDATGHVVRPDGAATLQWLHRLLGLASVVAFTALAFAVRGTRFQQPAVLGLIVVIISAAIGLTAGYQLPISLIVLHSLSGLIILLVLLSWMVPCCLGAAGNEDAA